MCFYSFWCTIEFFFFHFSGILRVNNVTNNAKFNLKDPRPADWDAIEAAETKTKQFRMKQVSWFVTVTWAKKDCCYLGIYLNCSAAVFSRRLNVDFMLTLISHIDKKYNVTRSFRHDFRTSDKSVGARNFVCVNDLDNERKGLLKNGQMTVELVATFI